MSDDDSVLVHLGGAIPFSHGRGMSFSAFQIAHPLESLSDDLAKQAETHAKSALRLRAAVNLIPGFTAPYCVLPALPLTGIRSPAGKDLGGFNAEPATAGVSDSSAPQLSARLELMNQTCAFMDQSKGRGRRKVRVDRETTCEQVYGNVRLDVTFGLRRGSMRGLAVMPAISRMTAEIVPAFQNEFHGVLVAAALAHMPNPWRDFANRAAGDADECTEGNDPAVTGRAAGMNVHPQLYTVRAFKSEWLSTHRKGFVKLSESNIALLQQRELGVDVHLATRVQKGVRIEWLLTVASPEQLAKLNDPEFRSWVGSVRSIPAADAGIAELVESRLRRWDAQWRHGHTIVDVLQRNLKAASEAQGAPVNWWLSDWSTRFLSTTLPTIDPRWHEYLAWGKKAAQWVLQQRIKTRFQVPALELLERYEMVDSSTHDLLRAIEIRAESEIAVLREELDDERTSRFAFEQADRERREESQLETRNLAATVDQLRLELADERKKHRVLHESNEKLTALATELVGARKRKKELERELFAEKAVNEHTNGDLQIATIMRGAIDVLAPEFEGQVDAISAALKIVARGEPPILEYRGFFQRSIGTDSPWVLKPSTFALLELFRHSKALGIKAAAATQVAQRGQEPRPLNAGDFEAVEKALHRDAAGHGTRTDKELLLPSNLDRLLGSTPPDTVGDVAPLLRAAKDYTASRAGIHEMADTKAVSDRDCEIGKLPSI